MTTTEQKKSSVLTDDDYRMAKAWSFNQASIARNLKDQGGIYEGILEAVQNAIDAPIDPDTDTNRIDITIPMLGDSEYGTVVCRVQDQGGSVTKDYNGEIQRFINAEKAISFKTIRKGVKRFGIGMAQFAAVSATQILVSQDREFIYRIPILLKDDGRPAYGNWTFHRITPENQAKFRIFTRGTVIDFVDPYEDMIRPDPMKVGKKIRETFGWRLLLQPNTDIWINEIIHVDLPDYLKGRTPKFIRRLKRSKVTDSNGHQRVVDAEVTGFIYFDAKGKGELHVHAGGYYIGLVKFADKRFSGAINIDEMPTDPSRRVMIDEVMKLDLDRQMIEETKHFPDIPTSSDDELGEKKHKSLTEGLNQLIEQFNLPKIFIENYEAEKRKRIETQNDPNGKEIPGYKKPGERQSPEPELETCELCNHLKKKSKKIRKTCSCECHIPREKGPNENIRMVGEDGDITCLTESQDIENIKKRSQFELNFTDEFDSEDKFLQLRTGRVLINKNSPMFRVVILRDKHSIERMLRNIIPYIANEIMDLKYPNAIVDNNLEEFRKTQEGFVRKMMVLM